MNLLAMAGPAEAAVAIAQLTAWASLILLLPLTLAGASLRTRKTGAVLMMLALLLAGITAVLFQPWMAFVPLSPEEMDDPDAVMWARSFKTFAVAWFVVIPMVLAGSLFVSITRFKRRVSVA